MFERILEAQIAKKWLSGKAILILGARQVGKTTLVREFLRKRGLWEQTRHFNCDNPTDREALAQKDFAWLDKLTGSARIVFIDEAQKVPNIGQSLKLLVDAYGREKQLIVSGSSSIHLMDQTQEALTGRKWTFHLYPLSLEEIYADKDPLLLHKELEERMIYGSYPEVVTINGFSEKRELLAELVSGYLYKDIYEFQLVKKPRMLDQLFKALALQLGSEVSYHELSNLLGIDKNTIERYVDLLEKNFVLFRLPPFFRNKRKELSKKHKIFFYDTGIRNAVLGDFRPLDSRTDRGALWENLLMTERLKFRTYHKVMCRPYFWRTYSQQEIDLVEECAEGVRAFEFKWSDARRPPAPAAWRERYPEASYEVITPSQLGGFVL